MLKALLSETFAVLVVLPMRSEVEVLLINKFENVCPAPNEVLPTGGSMTLALAPFSATVEVFALKLGLFNWKVTLEPLLNVEVPSNQDDEEAELFTSTAPLALDTVLVAAEPTCKKRTSYEPLFARPSIVIAPSVLLTVAE